MKISEHGHLLHLYYGEKLEDRDLSYLIPQICSSHESNPAEAGEDRIYSLCAFPQEFSSNDAGDFDLIEFYGHHFLERQFDRKRITHGITEMGSSRGVSAYFCRPQHRSTRLLLLR